MSAGSRQPRRAASMAAMSIFFIASKVRFASPPPAPSASVSARGDLPGEAPAVLAPTALAFRAAIADDRVPVTVRLFLILRRDLEGKGLSVPERRAAVETETENAQDGELNRQHIALLAARIVTGSLVNSGYFTIRKGDGVEARRLMRVPVEPEADRVLWLHVRVLLVLDQGERRGLCVGPYQCPPVYLLICYGRRLKLVAARPTLLNHIAGRDRLRDPKLCPANFRMIPDSGCS